MDFKLSNNEQKTVKAHSIIFEAVWSDLISRPVSHTDVMFKCKDGTVAAHKIVLASASKFLKNLFFEMSDNKAVTFVVPECSLTTVQLFLKLVYTGFVSITRREDLINLVRFGKRQMGFSMVYNHDIVLDVVTVKLGAKIKQLKSDNKTLLPKQNMFSGSDSDSAYLSETSVSSQNITCLTENLYTKSAAIKPNNGQAQRQSTADNETAVLEMTSRIKEEPHLSELISNNVLSVTNAPIITTETICVPVNQDNQIDVGAESKCSISSRFKLEAVKPCSVLLHRLKIPFVLPSVHSSNSLHVSKKMKPDTLKDNTRLEDSDNNVSTSNQTPIQEPPYKRFFECPDCFKIFYNPLPVLQHSVRTHYKNSLNRLLEKKYQDEGQICKICPTSKFQFCYLFIFHMVYKHKMMYAVTTAEIAPKYDQLILEMKDVETMQRCETEQDSLQKQTEKEQIPASIPQSTGEKAVKNVNGRKGFQCPQCTKSFATPATTLWHATLVHYGKQITKMLNQEFKANNGACPKCTIKCQHFTNYKYHVGVKHRLLFGLIKTEYVNHYKKILAQKHTRKDKTQNKVNNSNTNNGTHSKNKYIPNQLQQAEVIQLFQSPENVINHAISENTKEKCSNVPFKDQHYNSLQTLQPIAYHHKNNITPQKSPVNVAKIQTKGLTRDELVAVKPFIYNQCEQKQIHNEETEQQLQSFTTFKEGLTEQINKQQISSLVEKSMVTSKSLASNSEEAELSKIDENKINVYGKDKVHENQTQHVCPECGIPLSSSAVFLMHVASIHYHDKLTEFWTKDYEDKKGVCSLCSSRPTFKTASIYAMHMGIKHRLMLSILSPKLVPQCIYLMDQINYQLESEAATKKTIFDFPIDKNVKLKACLTSPGKSLTHSEQQNFTDKAKATSFLPESTNKLSVEDIFKNQKIFKQQTVHEELTTNKYKKADANQSCHIIQSTRNDISNQMEIKSTTFNALLHPSLKSIMQPGKASSNESQHNLSFISNFIFKDSSSEASRKTYYSVKEQQSRFVSKQLPLHVANLKPRRKILENKNGMKSQPKVLRNLVNILPKPLTGISQKSASHNDSFISTQACKPLTKTSEHKNALMPQLTASHNIVSLMPQPLAGIHPKNDSRSDCLDCNQDFSLGRKISGKENANKSMSEIIRNPDNKMPRLLVGIPQNSTPQLDSFITNQALKPLSNIPEQQNKVMQQITTSKKIVTLMPQPLTGIAQKRVPWHGSFISNQALKPFTTIPEHKTNRRPQLTPSKMIVNLNPQPFTKITKKSAPQLDYFISNQALKPSNKIAVSKIAVMPQPSSSMEPFIPGQKPLTGIHLERDPQADVLEDNLFFNLMFSKPENIADKPPSQIANYFVLKPEQSLNAPQFCEPLSNQVSSTTHTTPDIAVSKETYPLKNIQQKKLVQVVPDQLNAQKYPRKQEYYSKFGSNINNKVSKFIINNQTVLNEKPAPDYPTSKQEPQMKEIQHQVASEDMQQQCSGKQSLELDDCDEADLKPEPEEKVSCLVCANQFFPNLYEYQRHLALAHFQQQIVDKYLSACSSSSPYSCNICPPDKKLSFSFSTFLVIHLSTAHNCCLEFGDKDLCSQLLELQTRGP